MSKDKKKTESKTQVTDSSGTSNAVATGTAPDWITNALKGITGQVTTLGAADPTTYVAGADPLQTKAGVTAGGLTGSPWNFDTAADTFRKESQAGPNTYDAATGTGEGYAATAGKSASVLDGIENYMSPYRKDVVDAALADYDHGAGMTRQQQDLDMAGSGAFGGSGSALTRSATEDALTRGRATTSANLLDQMFQRGAALSADDANRRQGMETRNVDATTAAARYGADTGNQFGLTNLAARNAAGSYNAGAADRASVTRMNGAKGLIDTSTAFDGNQRDNAKTQADIGSIFQGIAQKKAQSPLDLASWQSSTLPSLLQGLFGKNVDTNTTAHENGNTTSSGTEHGSDAEKAQQAIQMIALLMSDRRLKCRVERIGTHALGIGIYAFNYIWGGPRQVGVMAQEVRKVKPSAVKRHWSGFMMVDYSQIGAL